MGCACAQVGVQGFKASRLQGFRVLGVVDEG